MEFMRIIKERYATKKFSGEKIPEDRVNELLEMIRFAPSSYGLQPFKVVVIEDKYTKEKLLPVSYNQPQITTCSHLLVFCGNSDIKAQIDKYEAMMKEMGTPQEKIDGYIGVMRGFEQNLDNPSKICWSQKQAYLALGNAVNGAKALGFDSCPMEGFMPDKYKEILNLPSNLHPVALVTIGIAADQKPIGKMRYSKEDLFISS